MSAPGDDIHIKREDDDDNNNIFYDAVANALDHSRKVRDDHYRTLYTKEI